MENMAKNDLKVEKALLAGLRKRHVWRDPDPNCVPRALFCHVCKYWMRVNKESLLEHPKGVFEVERDSECKGRPE